MLLNYLRSTKDRKKTIWSCPQQNKLLPTDHDHRTHKNREKLEYRVVSWTFQSAVCNSMQTLVSLFGFCFFKLHQQSTPLLRFTWLWAINDSN